MKEVFVVMFIEMSTYQNYVDSVWESEEEAQKWVNEMNEWERSEKGSGDLWIYVKIDYHAK